MHSFINFKVSIDRKQFDKYKERVPAVPGCVFLEIF
ncbi:hypothetical protein T10_258 [Trichinella papuae]|uniref:Uncharacterized protein n=1 Tax=Trichinella papuae TaxID=268474 RepID=A0A0V1LY76_9BILA|nr:hypothetical protein T10_258 [Trichinella papuae]